MNLAARAQIPAPILRTAAGEPPLGIGGLAFRDDQGEVFRPENSYAASGWIGVLELEDGQWLAQPPGFHIDAEQFGSRDLALRTAIARMVRKARKYMHAKEGEGTHWTEGYAGRVIEWALSLKPAKILDQGARENAAPPIGHPGTEDAKAGVTDDGFSESSGALIQNILGIPREASGTAREAPSTGSGTSDENQIVGTKSAPPTPDPVVAELVAAHRARKTYPVGHTFSMTNPVVNGHMVTLGTCSCSDNFSYPYGRFGFERMDAAIEAHWQKFDHLPDKVDGRGEPITQSALAPAMAADTATAPDLTDPPVAVAVSSQKKKRKKSQPGAGMTAEAPASQGAKAGGHPASNIADGPQHPRSEPALLKTPPDGAGSPSSLAQEMAAEPDPDWSPLLTAALDLAWREEAEQPDPVKEFEATLPALIGPDEKRRKVAEFKLALKQKAVNLGPLFGSVPPPSELAEIEA